MGETETANTSAQKKILRKKLEKITSDFTFSNLDFDRPNPKNKVLQFSNSPYFTSVLVKLDVNNDKLTASCSKGFSTTRMNFGIQSGSWYFEVVLIKSHVRVGVAQILAESNAPIGYDEFGYGIEDSNGSKLHCSKKRLYAEKPLLIGDVIGVHLIIPNNEIIERENNKDLIALIENQYPPLKLSEYKISQEILASGSIEFFINRKSMGIAFNNIYRGKYYPAISMFNGGEARIICNPDWFPLNSRPYSEIIFENQ